MTVNAQQISYVRDVASVGTRNLPPGGEQTLDLMLDLVPGNPQTLVDIGCNTGWASSTIAQRYPRAKVYGIDVSADMISAAKANYKQPNLEFELLDAAAIADRFSGIDAVLCAGSSAFFADETAAYSSACRALRAGGRFLNAHYVYDPDLPAAAREEVIKAFGLISMPQSASECLNIYESADLDVAQYRRLPRWDLPERRGADVYRDILRSIPDMRRLVDEMIARRRLINEVSPLRYPVVVECARPSEELIRTAVTPTDLVLRTLALFQSPFAAQPIERLRAMRPYEFLAYIGDPDTAPGGAASVSAAARLLTEHGLSSDARVLDVGCFTGMSTFTLAQSFPNTLGIDVDPVFVAAASKLGHALRSPASFGAVDGRTSGMPSDNFDAVVMTATLGYTPNPQQLVREAMRLLRPAGLFVEFFYHHRVRDQYEVQRVRESIGPDVRLVALSEQIADIERIGFQMLRAVRVPTPSAAAEAFDAIQETLTQWESERNPTFNSAQLMEFSDFIAKYFGRPMNTQLDSSAYLCVFEKPLGRNCYD